MTSSTVTGFAHVLVPRKPQGSAQAVHPSVLKPPMAHVLGSSLKPSPPAARVSLAGSGIENSTVPRKRLPGHGVTLQPAPHKPSVVVPMLAHATTPPARPQGLTLPQMPRDAPVVHAPVMAPVALGVTSRKKRKRIGSDFASHADFEAARRTRAVEEFVAIAPPEVLTALIGGDTAVSQVPCPVERARIVAAAVAHKAGPDGGSLEAAMRAWSAFVEFVSARGLPHYGLPASAALVASFLTHEGATAKGSQGGASVANSRRVGLLWLNEKLGFSIDVANVAVLAAGNPGQMRERRRADPVTHRKRKAGSIPIKIYCLFESLASAPEDTPTRFFARSIVAFSLIMSIRAIDALRTRLDPDERDPDHVVSGWSYYSKDGEPMRTYAPAIGFLGPLSWWPEHASAVARVGRPFPKWVIPHGGKGSVRKARGLPLPFVMPKDHFKKSLADCMCAGPLSLSVEAVSALGLTAHSEHGSPSDMAQSTHFSGGDGSDTISFGRDEVRELGHWLRLGEMEEGLEGGTAGAQNRRRGAGPGRQTSGAFANNASEMAAEYCQGDGRVGRRKTQIRVRTKWLTTVRKAILLYGRPWTELPEGRSDYDILDNI